MDILHSRRRFLMRMAAASTLLPLSASGLARMLLLSDTDQPKLKVVFFVVPDGLAIDSFADRQGFGDGRGLWHPVPHAAGAGDTAEFDLQEVSKKLEAYRGQSLYLRGLIAGLGNGGHNGWTDILRDRAASMSSIDVLLGQHLEGIDPRHRAVYAGPAVDNEGWHVSWSNKDKRSPERDPAVLAQSIFGAPGARRGGTQSLDMLAVTEKDAASFRSKVGGGAQRQKADVFAESVQQLIKDIGDTKPPEPGCHPEHPDKLPVYDPSTRTQVQANHHKVVATALACGITRVATIQVARSAESLNILDVSNLINPHAAAHRGINQGSTGDPALDEAAWKGTRQWYTDQVKLFMDELARHTDPDFPEDNLLKHTLVVYTSELSDGYPEHRIDMPLLLMGGAGGLLKNGDGNGRYLNITAQGDDDHHTGNPVIGKRMVNMQRVWATIALAAGTQVPYGGNVSPITGIFRNVT